MASNGFLRAADGRFAKGTAAGPGRPPRETEREYLAAFRKACSPETLAAVVAVVVREALAGDLVACKLLLSHALPWQARLELMNYAQPELAYRCAGRPPSATNSAMLARLVEAIKQNRERDAASGDWPPSD